MKNPDIHTFPTAEELAENLSEHIASILARAIAKQNHAGLVVSGGSTPKPFFQHLSQKNINWHMVNITLADERWVEPTDISSNENLVRAYLLQNRAVNGRFHGLKNSAPTATQGEKECHDLLAGLTRPFDAVILGMGNDGHTASFFPGADRLAKALNLNTKSNCVAISPPEAPHERMTLTLPILLDTRQIILHITGNDKKAVLEKALAPGPVEEMPIRCFLRQNRTPVHIYWAP